MDFSHLGNLRITFHLDLYLTLKELRHPPITRASPIFLFLRIRPDFFTDVLNFFLILKIDFKKSLKIHF